MSYAAAAKRGPGQSAEEAAAPPVPELVHSEEPDTHVLIDVDSPHISSVPSDFSDQPIKTETQAERIDHEKTAAKHKAEKVKEEGEKKAEAAKRKAKELEGKLERNSDNPVFVGNAVVTVVFATVFGTAAYRKISRDGFSWGLFGTGLGLVAAFGAADYYISQWLFQKYPPKK